METQHSEQQQYSEIQKNWEQSHRRGKIFGGILLVAAGSLFLARELGVDIPQWIFTWKTFLIALGLLVGVKHNFKNSSWLILILIGTAYIVADIYPTLFIKPLLWPVLLIIFGLYIIFKPRKKYSRIHWENKYKRHQHYKWHKHQNNYFQTTDSTIDNEDVINVTAIFGSIKKNIVSKNFKGGTININFGGAEINLSQADFNDTATIEISQTFGGTELIIPAHWQIKSELTSVLGSIEDQRTVQPNTAGNPPKILILKGSCTFGGIEIKSY